MSVGQLFRCLSVVVAVVVFQGATTAQEGQPARWGGVRWSSPTSGERKAAAAPAPEQLTEVERLRWELVALKSQLHAALAERDGCRAQLVPARGDAVKAEMAQLQEAVEKAHPGFTFDVTTGKLTPKPRAEPEKP